jgi:tRNA(Ile)-lysidine synthase
VVVGLSGGSDSVALSLLLLELARHGGFSLVALAHLNHGLRSSAGRDEYFCRRLAERVHTPIIVEVADVTGYAASQRFSIEDAARRLRYDFLHRAAVLTGADRIAVGHTEDDQAETFLLKLMRGAGLSGLAGIYPSRERVVRPLLTVSRAALREYLTALGEAWLEDETNENLDNPRNRIRHRVLPELERVWGSATRPAIARAAALAREDGQWLDQEGERRFEALMAPVPYGWEGDAKALEREPLPLLRRILLRAMREVAAEGEVGLEHVESALAVLAGRSGGADVPGGRVERRGGKLVVLQQDRP